MIEAKNLNFRYKSSKEDSIRNMSFSIKRGEIFGFLGPSGAGKSTVQKILLGLMKNYRGTVKVMGQEVKNCNGEYYEKIGVGFELPNLYMKLTAIENLEFFNKLYKNSCTNILELLKIVGLESHRHKKVEELSKGMKMRLNFCRALLNDPELLFLDEPTSGLDPNNSKVIEDIILKKKHEGKTIILTTHNMSIAEKICDRVAFVVDGEIKLIDSPRTLKLKYGDKKIRVEYKERDILQKDFNLKCLGENKEFLHIINDKKVEKIYTLEASLEEIFREVTGRILV